MENKVHIGRGRMEEFQKDYETISAGPGQRVQASQLFVVTGVVNPKQDAELKTVYFYEYVIYYTVISLPKVEVPELVM